jgi:preprotein translocase subunit SecD
MKEELRSGRDLRSAIDEGFKRAWTAIRDGNITTLIAAALLYGFSSSFIKGFALTLSIGVLLSMFTAISVSRVYLLVFQLIPFLRKESLYIRVKKSEKKV